MKKLLLVLLLFLSYPYAFGQKTMSKDSILFGMMGTTDQLYWNKQQYVVSKAFLSNFKGYKKIYPDVPIIEISSLFGYGLAPDINYFPIWLLKDSVLYLRNILFHQGFVFIKKIYPDKKQFTIMENLTGERFTKNRLKEGIRPPESEVGTMTARWVNGSFFCKKMIKNNENIQAWEDAPFVKLTFKNGKLISATEVSL